MNCIVDVCLRRESGMNDLGVVSHKKIESSQLKDLRFSSYFEISSFSFCCAIIAGRSHESIVTDKVGRERQSAAMLSSPFIHITSVSYSAMMESCVCCPSDLRGVAFMNANDRV